jgi:hypothetical protein
VLSFKRESPIKRGKRLQSKFRAAAQSHLAGTNENRLKSSGPSVRLDSSLMYWDPKSVVQVNMCFSSVFSN